MVRLLFVCCFSLAAGCCAAGVQPAIVQAPLPAGGAPAGVVLVANGSGDFRTVSTNLEWVVTEAHAPLAVETLVWSHGRGRYVTDHVDHANHLIQGRLLAARVAEHRRACPGRPVHLIGHSAGCAVVLAAAEMLPPDSVDRIVLLAPSVCVTYDLRPALRTARRGIDVYHSDEDRVILGLGMRIVGTADRACRVAAGQCGFTPVVTCPEDAALYSRLRQHPWCADVTWCGHDGGHYGSNQAGFLRAYVLPLLLSD